MVWKERRRESKESVNELSSPSEGAAERAKEKIIAKYRASHVMFIYYQQRLLCKSMILFYGNSHGIIHSS
jgi:hypothetical protein